MKCKYETSNGRCGLKDCYAYRHKCYTEEFCKCHQPQTNADRIRSMSDEELAEFLVGANPTNCLDCAFSCGWRCQPDRQDYSDTEKCVEGKKRWFKQPAEGE